MELLHGTLDVLILKALAWGPRHGYEVAHWIRERTDGRLNIEEGALYRSLHRMERRKWLSSEWGRSENGRRAKFYDLTKAGRAALANQTRTWLDYADAVFAVLRAEEVST